MPRIHDTPPPAPSISPSAMEEERRQNIRVKNRRKLYLDRHPSYFTAPDLELADPLLYDRCIRRFQSASEREADGKRKGYSGVLEADLYRSEARLQALQQNPQTHHASIVSNEPSSSSISTSTPASPNVPPVSTLPQAHGTPVPFVSYARGPNGEVLPEEEDEVPSSKEEGLSRWKFEMTLRFLRGDDDEFEYRDVDESEEWDVVERRESEERWFEDEEPEWVGEGEDGGVGGDTGVQDF